MQSTPRNLLHFRSGHPAADAASTLDALVGPSPAMARVWSQIRRVAPYFRTALLLGERGSGAEAAARALHSLSTLAQEPFLLLAPSDCETRLTGPAPARFSGQTLFFPEIEHLSLAAQQGLLRLMRQRRPHQVSVIAAATGELRPLVSAGGFSGLLATQLSALQITLPPLRDRRDDIPALATHLFTHEARSLGVLPQPLTPEFINELTACNWPGNVQQLQTVLRRLLERNPNATPNASAIGPLLEATSQPPAPALEPVRLLKLDQVIHEHIRAVLLRCNGNKLRAAEVLGISRSTLYRMLDARPDSEGNIPIAV